MKYFGTLSKDYNETFKSGEFHDIEILVGKKPDIKTFKLHSLILKIRSPFFRNELKNNKKLKYKNNIIEYNKPNISVKIFDILVRYIYDGIFNVKNDVKTNIALLIAADELQLHHINNVISMHLFKDQGSLKQNFVLIQHVTTKYTQFSKLTQFYKKTIKQDPSIIFETGDFVTIEKNVLLNLVKSNNSFKQIDVWDKLMEWTIAQSQELSSDTTKWTKENITTFGNLIQPFIPYINFKEINPKDFSQKIKPFKSIFDIDFYVQILEYYSSNEESHSKFGNNLMNINSNIINSDHAFLLGNFIKIAVQHDRDVTFDFELLIRGSRDGFDLQTFHDHCNEKGPTITVVSVKNTDEILGGYNPLNFGSTGTYCLCENSFLFSLDKNKLTNFIFSKVIDKLHAVYDYGIGFGAYRSDLRLLENNTNVGQCYKNSYEKLIRRRAGKFEIDDYEVFLVKTK
ncbi:hypothetical protein RhiirA4_548453 [Rhizophagus irregularis]|uniref:BTB-domain-containing protein n=1 Tax=Rhizophagus irregularis TaxID=588596 RepID=A0A2I1H7Q5_9GLOM|nr:hypothetical protein RhiirA4_548453 [Rhizophagus irregularis]